MPVQTSDLYNQWLHVLMHYAKTFSDRDVLWEKFAAHEGGLLHYLREQKLPLIGPTEYISVREGISRGLVDFVKQAPDRKKACGAVLWRFIKAVHPDMRNNTIQNKNKRPETYRQERRFQKNMMRILEGLHLDLSAKDKINALDYLEYKYSAEEYRCVYEQLGDYNFGEISEDIEYERIQTVKLFHELLKQSRKSTGKDKIVSAQAFLETVARNGRILDDARYTDIYGNVKMIDAAAKAEMLTAINKAKVSVSEECMAYFRGEPSSNVSMNAYIPIVLNKFRMADNSKKQKRILTQPFAVINMSLQKEQNISGKLVENYAEYLCLFASYHCDNSSIRPDMLESLLMREAEQSNKQVRASSLFAEYISPKELKTIDKKLVLEIARQYADSFACSAPEAEEFNPCFHERMSRMFCKIVKEHSYKKSEVQSLCDTLKSNDDKVMTKMAKSIMSVYTSSVQRRPSHIR
ncbi:MAG: hypothetical protein IJ479_07645 [Alphaproteobacteria bacterium]|nr:hypothetical protein [Alphaproteobacteria bacterium]